MSNNERINQWQSHINQWKESGLSGAKFCKRAELDLAQFYYWKNKSSSDARNIAVDKKRPTGFASVVISDSALVDDGLNFTLPNGCAIVGINGANFFCWCNIGTTVKQRYLRPSVDVPQVFLYRDVVDFRNYAG